MCSCIYDLLLLLCVCLPCFLASSRRSPLPPSLPPSLLVLRFYPLKLPRTLCAFLKLLTLAAPVCVVHPPPSVLLACLRLSACLLSVFLSFCLSFCPSVCLSVFLSVFLFVFLSSCLSVCLSGLPGLPGVLLLAVHGRGEQASGRFSRTKGNARLAFHEKEAQGEDPDLAGRVEGHGGRSEGHDAHELHVSPVLVFVWARGKGGGG